VSPDGGLKPQGSISSSSSKIKNKTANTQKVNSTGWWYMVTCELDLLCTAAAVVLVTNLISCSEEKKMSVGKK
jgi:hypothetical protein